MGMNYYATDRETGVETHVGKSSAGWKFCFREKEGLHNVYQWMNWLETQDITNEYGDVIDRYGFLKRVVLKSVLKSNAGDSSRRTDGLADYMDVDFC